jgi:hypothetical protein
VLIATGSVIDQSVSSTFTSADMARNGIIVYAGRDITLSGGGDGSLFNGMLYAPNGTIRVNSTGQAIRGSLVAARIAIDGATNTAISYDAAINPVTVNMPLVAPGFGAFTP